MPERRCLRADAAIPRPVFYLFGRQEPREYTRAWRDTVVALARLNRATGEKREWGPGYTEFVPGPDGEITVYGLYGAGHVWPLLANQYIVEFFRKHTLDETCGALEIPPPDPDQG